MGYIRNLLDRKNCMSQYCQIHILYQYSIYLIYISIDIDALDPCFAPGVGYIAPGGITSREMIYLIQRLSLLNPVAIDIVEVNPKKDINNLHYYILINELLYNTKK